MDEDALHEDALHEDGPREDGPHEDGPHEDERWHAVLAGVAPAAAWVYAVRTTRVYCRPGCRSRRPRPEHVLFFDTTELARASGYRACLRCRPDGPDERARQLAGVVAACRAIVAAGGPLPPAELERLTGLRARQLARASTDVTGVSPRAFGDAVRTGTARSLLRERGRVADAVFAAGFGSVRGFYETAGATLGMTPSAYAAGGAGEHLLWAATSTPVGCLLAVASVRGLCAVRLGPALPALLEEVTAEFAAAELLPAPGVLDDVLRGLAALAAGRSAGVDLPVDLRGTAFQARVWAALRQVPAGTTQSYGQVAASIGAPAAVRAVAGACAANRVALVVPCHRVVRGDGGLGGFRWGLEVKQALLDAERSPAAG